MPRFEMSTPFGAVFLEVTPEIAPPVVQSVRQADVQLSRGQRVDACLVGQIAFQAQWRDRVDLLLGCVAANGVDVGFAHGEFLHAMEAGRQGLCGALAIRDDEWFSEKFGCEAEYLTDASGTSLRFTSFKRMPDVIEYAVAWTESPLSENEEVAPWFAVDLAMRS